MNARLRTFDFILKAVGNCRMGERCLKRGGTQVIGDGLEKARQDASNLRKILAYGVSHISWALKDALEFCQAVYLLIKPSLAFLYVWPS